MELGLAGKVALVTGGSRGIGAAIALLLLESGCEVTITARTKESLAAFVENAPTSQRTRLNIITCDLDDEKQVTKLVRHLAASKIDATNQLKMKTEPPCMCSEDLQMQPTTYFHGIIVIGDE